MRLLLFGLSAAAATSAGAAVAGEAFVGVYAHDVEAIALGGSEGGSQIAVGYRTEPIERLRAVGQPSLYGFGAANTSGGVNYAAAGLSWRLGKKLFVRPGVGLAVHTGKVAMFQRGQELNLGSRVLAELELGLGWRFGERLAVEASIVHLSHAQSRGRQNPGLDDIGVRLTYGF